MNRLIGDLIDVVSIDAGKLSMQPRASDARQLVSEAIEAFSPAAHERAIALEVDSGGSSLPLTFDYERVLQVLANLITNAIKFTDRGGTVTVRADLAPAELRVSVTDTGTGIPEEMLERIFERFWQVGKTEHRGVGLGLYISKCIVEAHGGRIWAESRLGAGSTFHFVIPRIGERST